MTSLTNVAVFLVISGTALSGCFSKEEPEWTYDRADMEQAVYGTWSGTLTLDGDEARPFTLSIRSHDEPMRAPACGNRTFQSGTEEPSLELECVSVSSLALSGTLALEGEDPVELDGGFSADSTSLTYGSIGLDFRADVRRLEASWERGVFSACSLRNDLAPMGTCTLDARAE